MDSKSASEDSGKDPGDLSALGPVNLDMRYFTAANLCPQIVRRKSRRAFELFLFVATNTQRGRPGRAFTHEELCSACGLISTEPNSRSIISRLLRHLRSEIPVLDCQPQRSRRPNLALRPLPRRELASRGASYVPLAYGWWNAQKRALFNLAGRQAFAAEYMYVIALYESRLARARYGREYWFFPLMQIADVYHISQPFAGSGLRALIKAGVMRVMHGQYKRSSPEGFFGKANRYYFHGLEGAIALQQEQADLREIHPKEYILALELSHELTNGPSTKNLAVLCQLIASEGADRVRSAIAVVTRYPKTSLRRRVGFVRSLVLSDK